MGWKYTEELLREAVANSVSYAGVLRYLGVAHSGGMHAHISRSVKRYGIDTRHFTGQGCRRGRTFPDPRPPEALLCLRPPGSSRITGRRLRTALLGTGRPYICEKCGNGGCWMLRPLILHVDHISGDHRDCRSENLRFLCPNCHSQTPTHAGRNVPRRQRAEPVDLQLLIDDG